MSEDPTAEVYQAFKSSIYMVLLVRRIIVGGPPWVQMVIRRHDGRRIGRKTGLLATVSKIARELGIERRLLLELGTDERSTDETVMAWVPHDLYRWPPEGA